MSSRLFPSRSSLIAAACLGLLTPVAQAQSLGRGRSDTTQDQAAAVQRAAHAAAKSAAARGDFAAAALAIEAAGIAPANSAARSFETAQKLTLLASDLSRDGNPAGAQAAALTALQYLTQAAQRTNSPELQAAIQSQAGFLHERYLGNTAAASASYRAAAQLTPGNAALREKAERFDKADAEVRRKAAQNR